MPQKLPRDRGGAGRRGSERAIALFRPAIIEAAGLETFCLVKNISSGGLMAMVQAPFMNEQEVCLRFSEWVNARGNVVWVQDDRIGVKFLSHIDVSAFLAELTNGSSGVSPYRSPRLRVKCEGEFIVHSERRQIELLDIAQRGFKAQISSVVVGEEGIMILQGMEPRRAVVRWTDGENAGFYLIDSIALSELSNWIMRQFQNFPSSDNSRISVL